MQHFGAQEKPAQEPVRAERSVIHQVTSGIGTAVLVWIVGVATVGLITYGLLTHYDVVGQFSVAWFISGGIGIFIGVITTKLIHMSMRKRSSVFAGTFVWFSALLAVGVIAAIAIIGTH